DQRLEAQALLEGEPRSLADRAAKQQRGDEQHRDDDQRRHGAEDDRSGFQIHGGLLRGAARLPAATRARIPDHLAFAWAPTAAPQRRSSPLRPREESRVLPNYRLSVRGPLLTASGATPRSSTTPA